MATSNRFFTGMLLWLFVAAALAEDIPFDESHWVVEAETSEFLEHKGRTALLLRSGMAWPTGVDLTDGVIEFDMLFGPERGFSGAFWRMQDSGNFEQFYVRPHQSGNPDANQYQPVFNGVAAWQLYHGPAFATPLAYATDQWIRVRIIFSGYRAAVYIDSGEPVLIVDPVRRPIASGRVGLAVSNFAPAYFSNFSVRPPRDSDESIPEGRQIEPLPDKVESWQVSNAFAESEVVSLNSIADLTDHVSWVGISSDKAGIVNLAEVQGIVDDRNTVFARLTLESDSERRVTFPFGCSDRCRIYLNGELMYQGNNVYQSRDYRYLGTIGLFDAVELPLRAGRNELLVAVSEAFGGWGLVAQLPDLSGVSIINQN